MIRSHVVINMTGKSDKHPRYIIIAQSLKQQNNSPQITPKDSEEGMQVEGYFSAKVWSRLNNLIEPFIHG